MVRSLIVEAQFGDVVLMDVVVDPGSMVNLPSTAAFGASGKQLKPASLTLPMANAAVETPAGEVQVTVGVKSAKVPSKFCVVTIPGDYDALLGKPWLSQVAATSFRQC